MKIGIDIRSLQDKQKSGVGEYTFGLLAALFKIDRQNEYYPFSNARNIKQVDIPESNGAKVSHKHFQYSNKYLNFKFKFFNKPKIDKLLGVDLDAFIFPNINFYSLSQGIKKILVVHDLSYELYPSFYSPKSRLWHKMINAKKFCREADKIVAVSENTKNDIINVFNIPEEKVITIYPGISDSMRPVTDRAKLAEVKEKYNLPSKFILYLGTIEPRKNIRGLMQAFDILKTKSDLPHKLVIAGAKGYKSEKILKKDYKIQYIDYVVAEDKPALYTLADLFVYPSFYEGFGFPPLEALSCGTPVVASHAGSLGEVLGKAALLVNPHNASEIADGMINILQDEATKKIFIEQAHGVLEKYSWEQNARRWLDKIM